MLPPIFRSTLRIGGRGGPLDLFLHTITLNVKGTRAKVPIKSESRSLKLEKRTTFDLIEIHRGMIIITMIVTNPDRTESYLLLQVETYNVPNDKIIDIQ